MNAWGVGLITFVCVLGGAFAGIGLRRMLPEHHLSDDSKDVVKVVTGLMATLSALVLGLLVASAKSSFDAVTETFKHAAAKVILIDRALANYGPAAKEVRETLRATYAAQADRLFPEGARTADAAGYLRDDSLAQALAVKLHTLAPADDAQRALKAHAEQHLLDLAQVRWLGFEHARSSTPHAFLLVLVSWLTAMFAGFGLFAPRNATAIAALAIGALAVAMAIVLIEELGDPLGGAIALSVEPMRQALSVLGK
jgi:hypothetical protein